MRQMEETAECSQGTDKAWYILFNCFANSLNLRVSSGLDAGDWERVAAMFIGGKRFHRADWYIINLVDRSEIPVTSEALSRVTTDALKERYYNVNRGWFQLGDYQASDT